MKKTLIGSLLIIEIFFNSCNKNDEGNLSSSIDELNYKNNVGYFNLYLGTPSGNDLVVENVQSPQHHVGSPGGDWNISFRINNIGPGGSVAQATNVKIYLSSDKTLSVNDVLVQQTLTNSINSGYYQDFSSFIHIPSGYSSDTYLFILIKVNPDNTISETNYNNNLNQFSLHIGTPPNNGIDLTVEGLTSTQHNVGSPGGDWNINYSVGNIGQSMQAPSSKVKIFLSEDTEYSSNDVLITEDNISSLNVGQFQQKSTFIHIPSGYSNTYKFLLVVANPDKII